MSKMVPLFRNVIGVFAEQILGNLQELLLMLPVSCIGNWYSYVRTLFQTKFIFYGDLDLPYNTLLAGIAEQE